MSENLDRFKFRAWDKVKAKMITPNLIRFDVDSEITHFDVDDGIDKSEPFDNIIIMQCTGLKDKNDKLIYEKDVVRVYDEDDELLCKGVIKWIDTGFVCCCSEQQASDCNILSDYDNYSFEVIGNIYENQELLN